MKFDVLTLFPEMFEPLKESIIKRATEKNLIDINLINIRDFSEDKHMHVDDTPYGGGAGMLIKPDVVGRAVASVKTEKSKVIYLSPRGKTLNQNKVKSLAESDHLILLCGHYEGIDQRVIDKVVDEEISIGDYVLTGGELPAMVLIDSVSRYVPGVLTEESTDEEGNIIEETKEGNCANSIICPSYIYLDLFLEKSKYMVKTRLKVIAYISAKEIKLINIYIMVFV